MIDIDVKKVDDIIRHVAATEVMPRFNNLQISEIRQKNPGDFVTVADEASEREFTRLLQEVLPGSLVVGEEAVSKDPSVINKFREGPPVWIIDPIDGTYNFSHGSRKFGILIALVHNGKTLYGWAFDAPGNRMAMAKRDAGAYLDGRKVTLAADDKPLPDTVGRGGGYGMRRGSNAAFKELLNQRCSLHDFMDFITGHADFIVHMPRVTPWDHAAGCLIAAETGAHVAMNSVNEAYDPTLLGPAFLIVAPTAERWSELYPVLHP